jgi:hypothetical protein
VQRFAARAERLLQTLIRACAETIERDRECLNAQFRHRDISV